MSKKKHFGFKKMIPCYTEEGRCEECCGDLGGFSLSLLSVYPKAWELAQEVLEPVREQYGRPIRVLRCFQCHAMVKKQELDERYETGEVADVCAVAGLPRKFDAVRRVCSRSTTLEQDSALCSLNRSLQDPCEVPEVTREENLKIARIIEEMVDFDQLVYVDCDREGRPSWLQVSYRSKEANRHEVSCKL